MKRGENMNKILKRIFGFGVVAFAVIPMLSVQAVTKASTHVTTQAELETAIDDATITSIVLDNDINITRKLNVTNPKTIDGAGHAITYTGTFKGGVTDNKVWGSNDVAPYDGGVYILNIYRTTATIKNIKLTGGNAAINVNGSNLTLVGNVDVSGNGFGGIELSKGVGVTEYPTVLASNSVIKNTSEGKLLPTVWVDGITLEEIRDNNVDFVASDDTFQGAVFTVSSGQMKLYLDSTNVPAEDNDTIVIPIAPQPTPTPTPTPAPTVTPDTTVSTNPNTFDGITAYFAMAIAGIGAVLFSSKKVYDKIRG